MGGDGPSGQALTTGLDMNQTPDKCGDDPQGRRSSEASSPALRLERRGSPALPGRDRPAADSGRAPGQRGTARPGARGLADGDLGPRPAPPHPLEVAAARPDLRLRVGAPRVDLPDVPRPRAARGPPPGGVARGCQRLVRLLQPVRLRVRGGEPGGHPGLELGLHHPPGGPAGHARALAALPRDGGDVRRRAAAAPGGRAVPMAPHARRRPAGRRRPRRALDRHRHRHPRRASSGTSRSPRPSGSSSARWVEFRPW
jgi:hypothetical protein